MFKNNAAVAYGREMALRWHLILVLLLTLGSMASRATESPKPVFVKSVCKGKVSSELLSSLIDELRTFQRYRLISSLDENGHTGVVLQILMSCADRETVVAVATVYGIAKCSSATNCHSVVDGSSLNVALCDSKVAKDCGRALFKAFDAYVSSSNPSRLKLE